MGKERRLAEVHLFLSSFSKEGKLIKGVWREVGEEKKLLIVNLVERKLKGGVHVWVFEKSGDCRKAEYNCNRRTGSPHAPSVPSFFPSPSHPTLLPSYFPRCLDWNLPYSHFAPSRLPQLVFCFPAFDSFFLSFSFSLSPNTSTTIRATILTLIPAGFIVQHDLSMTLDGRQGLRVCLVN